MIVTRLTCCGFVIFSLDGFTNLVFANPEFFATYLLLVLISSKQIFVWESKCTKKCQHNHSFVLNFHQKLITNRQFRIHAYKIRETIWWAVHRLRNWRNNESLSLQLTCIEFRSRGCNNKYLVSHKQSVEDFKSKHYSLEAKGLLCEKENQVRASYQYNWNELPSKCCIRNDSSLHWWFKNTCWKLI